MIKIKIYYSFNNKQSQRGVRLKFLEINFMYQIQKLYLKQLWYGKDKYY